MLQKLAMEKTCACDELIVFVHVAEIGHGKTLRPAMN